MVSVTSDIASSVSFSNARSKSGRDDQPSEAISFSSMVDNNAVNAGRDRPDPSPPDAPSLSPSRDQRSAKADDSAQRRDDRADAAAASDARKQDAQTKAASDRADAAADDRAGKSAHADNKSDDGKLDKDTVKGSATADEAKASKDGEAAKDGKSAKDGKDSVSADTATDVAPTEQAVPVAAVAVVIPVAAATVDGTAAPAEGNPGSGNGAAAPLAIAAAVLKAQTAAAEAASSGTETPAERATPAATDPDFAALIAAATPAAAKTAAKEAKPATMPKKAENAGKSETTHSGALTTPQQTPAAASETKGAKTAGDVPADGAKPENGDAVTKPAVHAAHERATPDATQIASTTTPQPANATLQPLQAAAPVVATAPQFTAMLSASTPVPLNGVAVEIAQSAQSGKSRFDIRLDPAELGRIDVRLDVDRDGNVTSHLTVEKPETLAMLRQDAPQLQRALEQAGMKTSDGGLQFSLRDQSQGQQQNNGDHSGRSAQRLIISEDDSIPAVTVGRNYGRMLGFSRGVDISI